MKKDKRDKLAGIWGHQLMLLLRQSDLQQLATPTISITNKMADAHGVPPFLTFLPHDIFWSSSTWRRWLNCSIKAERNHDRCCWRCDVKLACDGAVRQQRLCHAKGGPLTAGAVRGCISTAMAQVWLLRTAEMYDILSDCP